MNTTDVAPTHKLILSDKEGEAWLLDVEKDPDGLVNFARESDQAETLRFLASRSYLTEKTAGTENSPNPATAGSCESFCNPPIVEDLPHCPAPKVTDLDYSQN